MRTSLNQIKPKQTNPNQTNPNQTKDMSGEALFESAQVGVETVGQRGKSVSGGGGGSLADLLERDSEAFKQLAESAGRDIPPPGYMSKDQAGRYMAQIRNLFPGADGNMVEMVLAKWVCLHDVGGVQDFTGKPPIVVGTHSVAATKIFGEIIPTDNRGLARQFCATRFEKVVDAILVACPDVRAGLTPKALECGLKRGDEGLVVSFKRGGLPGTADSRGLRSAARRRALRGSYGATYEPTVEEVRPAEVPPVTRTDLY